MKKYTEKNKKDPALHASLTIEAALALPIFMLFTTAILYLLVILSLQADIRLAMEEALRDLGKQAYLAQAEDTETGINYLTIRAAVLSDELKERIEGSRIENGTDGFSTSLSSYDDETGILDIVAAYTYEIPFLPEDIGSLKFVQRVRGRAWIGEDISGDEGSSAEGLIVYITPTGTVYHTTTSCPYLDLSISQISFENVSSERNKSGSKYTACTSCCKKSTYESVYITDYGTNYHSTLSCSKLKRTVLAVDISQVGARAACSKCGD